MGAEGFYISNSSTPLYAGSYFAISLYTVYQTENDFFHAMVAYLNRGLASHVPKVAKTRCC